MRRNSTTWGMIASSGALVLTLAACGGDSPEVVDPGTPTQDVSTDDGASTETDPGDAADATTDEAGDDTGTETDTDTGGGEQAAGTSISPDEFITMLKSPGMENMTSFTLDMNMGMEGQSMIMTGAADLSDGTAMDIQMEVPGAGNIHMILVDGEAFMSMPGVTEEGQFVQMPLEELMGADADEFTNQVDITSQWDDWEAGAQEVTFVGVEDVDGEQLNHYELLLDTSKVESEDMAGMPGELTYDVWLDDQNFMRQVTFELEGVEAVMKMDNWGEPVDIAAPDAADVMQMPGMPTGR